MPLIPSSDSIALQHRQYEGCATVVPVATWLPPSYTSCIVQETPMPCFVPYPPSTCPAATPTPQPHLPKSNSDSSQSQSGSQSNTSSDASVNVSGGGGRDGSQSTAIIVGVTIGAVALLILIVILAVRGARRRHRRRPPGSEGGNVLGPNYLTASARSDMRAPHMYGHRDQRSTDVGDGGGGEGAPGKAGTGDGRDRRVNPPAGVGRDASKSSEKRAGRDISRGTLISISEPQPPAEVRKADGRQPESPHQRPSRQSSIARSSRSRYRAEGHDEHPENDIFYSPGPRRERIQRRKRRQGDGGLEAEDHVSPFGRGEGGKRTTNDIPLPSSPMRDVRTRKGDVGELDRVDGDVQSPSTGRWRR